MDNNNVTYAPIIIPTLCRYEHFKCCVESLSKNTHADKTELYIALDYPAKENHWEGYRKISAYIESIKGFKKVIIFKREKNYGAEKNSELLCEYVMSLYDTFIFTEDDNEFSPNFIDFINQGLSLYKDNDKVLAVCGYTKIHENIVDGIFFSSHYSAWGTGFWTKKYKKFEHEAKNNIHYKRDLVMHKIYAINMCFKNPFMFNAVLNMIIRNKDYGDAYFLSYTYSHNLFNLFPMISKVRNHGNDGSGENCKNLKNDKYQFQQIDNNDTFMMNYVEVEKNKMIEKRMSKIYKKNILYSVYVFIKLLYIYLFKNKN